MIVYTFALRLALLYAVDVVRWVALDPDPLFGKMTPIGAHRRRPEGLIDGWLDDALAPEAAQTTAQDTRPRKFGYPEPPTEREPAGKDRPRTVAVLPIRASAVEIPISAILANG